jgi:hypothetical protein
MIEAGATSTGPFRDRDIGCARPTGDSHARTTRGPAQGRGGTKQRPHQGWGPKKRGQRQYKGRDTPKDAPTDPITYVASSAQRRQGMASKASYSSPSSPV